MILVNDYFMIISGNFFANCMVHTLWPQMKDAHAWLTLKKIANDKWLFYDHIWPFFANCTFISHKTEVQMVILKCLKSLNPNWFKSYDTTGLELALVSRVPGTRRIFGQ